MGTVRNARQAAIRSTACICTRCSAMTPRKCACTASPSSARRRSAASSSGRTSSRVVGAGKSGGSVSGPKPGAARPAFLTICLNAPCRLVGVAQRRGVLVREDRLGQGLEQRHEALDAVGQRPRRDRQPHVGEPRRDPMQGTAADEAFVEHARPDADPVGRGVEQPRHRRRGHVARRGRALATPAPAGPDDGVLVGLDIDLEQSGAPLAVGGIGLAAARTYARDLRWSVRPP